MIQTPPPFRVRDFATPDAAGVLDVILSIQREEFGFAITAADQPDLADVPGFYQTGQGGFWVAEHHGQVIGTIGLKDIGAGQGALRKMFVAAPFRGGALGVAAALLSRLLAEARRNGMTEVFLGTTDRFLAAHRFYEKNGFAALPKAALPDTFPLMAVDTRFYRIGLAG
jgi:N-acetylglutamate synthase-like GNAT family acetyltransferase